MSLKRVVLHWTAGAGSPSALDLEHYHLLIDRSGGEHLGKLKPEANVSTADGNYAAHTRSLNTGSIGVALCGMHGAQERPYRSGDYPLTEVQLKAAVRSVADLCETYGIPVTRQTVLTHAEVQPTLGVRQSGKWDITVLPGMSAPANPVAVGDKLRAMIMAEMASITGPATIPSTGLAGLIARLISFIATGKWRTQ